jgi:DNA-directed RNA polymerase specialized sigma24 family protein
MNKRETDRKSLEEKETQLAGLFNEYYPRLAGYAYNHTGNRAVAEDIAGDVFLRAALLEREHELTEVKEAMKHLSPAQQEVIRLRFAGGLSSKETAALMGKSDGAVREMQREALKRLRMMLGEEPNS